MVMTFSVNDNETLRRISGGDLALFAKSTRDFLSAASAPEAPVVMPEPARAPAQPAPAAVPVVEKQD